MTLLLNCFRIPFMQNNPVLTLEAEDTKWTNGVDPTFLCKSEIFQGGLEKILLMPTLIQVFVS